MGEMIATCCWECTARLGLAYSNAGLAPDFAKFRNKAKSSAGFRLWPTVSKCLSLDDHSFNAPLHHVS